MADFKIEPELVYKELWKGREFELTHLWQRSVYVVTFMIAVATAYGTVLLKIVFPDTDISDSQQINFCSGTELQQKILIGLTCLGSVFSMLYTMMAKGSKYWYERYEAGIQHFTTGDYAKEIKRYDSSIPCHGNLPKGEKDKLSDNPLSPLAGRYSVSKVNISIGIVSLFIWGLLTIIHTTIYTKTVMKASDDYQSLTIGIMFCAVFNVILFFLLRLLCRSSDEENAN